MSRPSRQTLGTLVARLHPALLDIVCAPAGLEIVVGDPVILDPHDELPPPPGSVALAVGVETEREQLSLLGTLTSAGVAAVVLRADEAPSQRVLQAATDGGLALLAAPPGLSWGQLYTLLLTAATVPAPDRADVPLGDLFALANAIAAMVGGATTIEDAQNRVLAYSNLDHEIDLPRQQTILGRQVPTAWISRLQESGVFRRLWQTNDVVRIADFVEEPDYLPRIAVAVRAGGELLGSIWVIEGKERLSERSEQTLRDAADLAALHLLRHRAGVDVERRHRAEALLGVLEGSDTGERVRAALETSRGQPLTVVAFAVGGVADADAVVSAQRIADLVAVYSESYRRQAACTVSGRRVYALVPVDGERGDDAVIALARDVVERSTSALRIRVVAGVGPTVTALDDVASCRDDADRVADVLLERASGDDVATLADVQAQVVLAALRAVAADRPELAGGRLQLLAEQDAVKGTAWVPTLRAYFDAYGDMAAAAAQVNVHPNTFRYRLRRIIEHFGLDLSDPDTRLVAELQLRFLDRER